jgi:hypothetical protein
MASLAMLWYAWLDMAAETALTNLQVHIKAGMLLCRQAGMRIAAVLVDTHALVLPLSPCRASGCSDLQVFTCLLVFSIHFRLDATSSAVRLKRAGFSAATSTAELSSFSCRARVQTQGTCEGRVITNAECGPCVSIVVTCDNLQQESMQFNTCCH